MNEMHADLPLLDEAVLTELRASTGDDEEFVRDLVATYVDDAATNIADLATAVGEKDAHAMVRPAHTLKSTSASVGAMRLSALCRDIEAVGRDGNVDGTGAALDRVRGTWAETLEAFRAAGLAA
jgi:HPt (histidine-containing phosphotransfer) domain-containing protein